MRDDNSEAGVKSAPDLISRELQAARNEVLEVHQQEELIRHDIAENAASYIASLDQAATQASAQLIAEQGMRAKKLEALKQRLDACVASGDNDGMMALLEEIAQLELGG